MKAISDHTGSPRSTASSDSREACGAAGWGQLHLRVWNGLRWDGNAVQPCTLRCKRTVVCVVWPGKEGLRSSWLPGGQTRLSGSAWQQLPLTPWAPSRVPTQPVLRPQWPPCSQGDQQSSRGHSSDQLWDKEAVWSPPTCYLSAELSGVGLSKGVTCCQRITLTVLLAKIPGLLKSF